MNGTLKMQGISFIFPVETHRTEIGKQNLDNSNGINSTSPTFHFGRICSEPFLVYILIALNIMLVLVGAFNNCLVASIVWRTRLMQNPTNLLLSNNAIAEVIYLLASGSVFIIQILLRMGVFTLSQSLLILRASGLINMMIAASYIVASANLALLAIERFNALCKPMKTQRRLGRRSAKLSVLTMWLAAIILMLPLIVSLTRSKAGYMDMEYLIYYCSLSGTIPTIAGCTIIYCYGRIIHGIYISRSIFNQTCSVTASEDIRAKRNIVKMLLSITLTFVMTKFPIAAYTAMILVIRPQMDCSVIFVVTLAHLSAFLNPIIYFVFSSNYRREAGRLLKSCSHNRVAGQDESSNTSNLNI